MIPCASPQQQYIALKDEIQAALNRVLEKGHYVLGEEVRAFEQEFAAYIGLRQFVGVANGTDALQIALTAAGVGPGDEVITTPHTAVATVSAIVQTGAWPVLVDIEDGYFTLDPAQVRAQIGPKTKAVIAVHIYGQSCDMDALVRLCEEHRLTLIEDCAQAHGALWRGKKLGSIGRLSCFSFYPTKNLGAIGDGGGVGTNDPALAERIRLLRQYGWKERYVSAIHGWNSRLDEIQAAILRVKLAHLDRENERRRAIAALYEKSLAGKKGLTLPKIRAEATSVFHLYAALAERRDELVKFLADNGAQALVHYPVPVHQQPGYASLARFSALPVAEKIAQHELSLPMHPYLSDAAVEKVCGLIQRF